MTPVIPAWLSVLLVVSASVAVLAGMAYAEVRPHWADRIVGSVAVLGAAATIVGVLAIVV